MPSHEGVLRCSVVIEPQGRAADQGRVKPHGECLGDSFEEEDKLSPAREMEKEPCGY